jgi:membrane associated rhomboid family serine protease
MAFNRSNFSNNYFRPSPFGGFSFFPPIIKTLMIANIAVFLGIMFLGSFHIGEISLGGLLEEWFALQPLGRGFLVWQVFTYMFMHAGFSHLFFNMFALWMFGMELENVWGSRKFLTYYLICGVGAGIANLLLAPLFSEVGPTIGASGAIYGVLLAFGMLFPDRLIFIYFFVPLKAKYFVALYMIIEFVTVGIGGTDGVAHFAHLGGAFVGFVYLMLEGYNLSFFKPRENRQSTPHQWTSTHTRPIEYSNVADAQVYDIKDHAPKTPSAATQKEIDEILDKISHGGYQSLNDDEKKKLFEASKKLN